MVLAELVHVAAHLQTLLRPYLADLPPYFDMGSVS
jgi:hypothetical protein